MATRAIQDAAPKIPDAAAAIVSLLNSRPHATPTLPDTLDDPAKAGAILRPFGQPDDIPAPPQRTEQVRALRSTLMDAISAPKEEDGDGGAAWTNLTKQAPTVKFQYEFSAPGSVRLHQVSGDPVIGSILMTVADLITAGTWSRVRICANDACHGVFYDATRSRTQRWHSYETCGNRANVAAFRARKDAPEQIA
jgi:predicted RNA-binding Zn ribbon-like protein